MTHGESWLEQKRALESKGLSHQQINALPERMERREACKYYNEKLFDYFLDCMDISVPIQFRVKALSLMMYGDKDRHKFFNKGKE